MSEAFDPTLAGMPMAILSGKYSQNYWPENGLSDVMETYRKRQPARDVAEARKNVTESEKMSRENAAYTAEKKRIQDDLASAEAELRNLEDREKLLVIQMGEGGPGRWNSRLPLGDAPQAPATPELTAPNVNDAPSWLYQPMDNSRLPIGGVPALPASWAEQQNAQQDIQGYTPAMAGYKPSTAGKY